MSKLVTQAWHTVFRVSKLNMYAYGKQCFYRLLFWTNISAPSFQVNLGSNWPASSIGGGCYWEHDGVSVCDQVILGDTPEGATVGCENNATRSNNGGRFPERYARR